jgi:hypothetical protein
MMPMMEHFQAVREEKALSWGEGHKAGQASMAPKIERLYAELARLNRALDVEKSRVAALTATRSPVRVKAKA